MQKLIIVLMTLCCGSTFAADTSWKVPKIAAPQIPDRMFSVTEYGAVADGKTMNTKAFAAAIDTCAKAGGGKVIVVEGTYLTGPIQLVSNLELHLEQGATLLFTDDKEQYPIGGFQP